VRRYPVTDPSCTQMPTTAAVTQAAGVPVLLAAAYDPSGGLSRPQELVKEVPLARGSRHRQIRFFAFTAPVRNWAQFRISWSSRPGDRDRFFRRSMDSSSTAVRGATGSSRQDNRDGTSGDVPELRKIFRPLHGPLRDCSQPATCSENKSRRADETSPIGSPVSFRDDQACEPLV